LRAGYTFFDVQGRLDDNAVLAYVENRLSTEERARVERHVDGCPPCRALSSDVARAASGVTPGRSSPSPEPVGERIGRFRLVAKLSQGGLC
jgi:anti-sigma factor RsiW